MREREIIEQTDYRKCDKCGRLSVGSLALYCIKCGNLLGLPKYEKLDELDKFITSSSSNCSKLNHDRRREANIKYCPVCGEKLQ